MFTYRGFGKHMGTHGNTGTREHGQFQLGNRGTRAKCVSRKQDNKKQFLGSQEQNPMKGIFAGRWTGVWVCIMNSGGKEHRSGRVSNHSDHLWKCLLCAQIEELTCARQNLFLWTGCRQYVKNNLLSLTYQLGQTPFYRLSSIEHHEVTKAPRSHVYTLQPSPKISSLYNFFPRRMLHHCKYKPAHLFHKYQTNQINMTNSICF